mmetsp:Transcript_8823/g.9933  ORF Transcript_8823/g.9933 Transcript_8823/m.9933 type:complete len:106 (+) Transcript_8823:362-679(+)
MSFIMGFIRCLVMMAFAVVMLFMTVFVVMSMIIFTVMIMSMIMTVASVAMRMSMQRAMSMRTIVTILMQHLHHCQVGNESKASNEKHQFSIDLLRLNELHDSFVD